MQTPVVFLIFNRPDATERVFAEIAKAKPPKLFVIADGPRQDRPGEAQKCAAARAIVDRVEWDCEVLKNYSDVNLGCGRRVGTGITWVFDQVEEAIILEDDCVPHQTFFPFCEELLERYRTDERVMHIAGSNLQFGHQRTSFSYFFSRHNIIWGWATWRRAWQHFDLRVKSWPMLRNTTWLVDILGSSGAADFYRKMFDCAHFGEVDSWTWDYQWTFACWTHNGLSILPKTTLVSNIGFSEDATHTKGVNKKMSYLPVERMVFPLQHPPCVSRHKKADDFLVEEVFRLTKPKRPSGNLLRSICGILPRSVSFLRSKWLTSF